VEGLSLVLVLLNENQVFNRLSSQVFNRLSSQVFNRLSSQVFNSTQYIYISAGRELHETDSK
jgi:hypothetical protein